MIKTITAGILVAMLQQRLGVAACCNNTMVPTTLAKLDPNEWWGPADTECVSDASITPFKVTFSKEMILNLKGLLKNHRNLVPPLEGINFEYGFNSKLIPSLIKYWSEEYNFEEREKFFNQFPQFRTYIQGLKIHFIWVRPQVPAGMTVVPLLLLHGWPGSIREFYEAIPLLTKLREGYDFVFEVIVPSLPGYGFSDPAVRPGLGAAQVGVIFKNLMNRLGHKKYYVQGGDWGSMIANLMSTMFQDEVLGYHSNLMAIVNRQIALLVPYFVTEPRLTKVLYSQSAEFNSLVEETGYFHLQATKPDTLGICLSNSPVGLLAYILEKFSTWTRNDYRHLPDGGLFNHFTKEQLIDNLMVYWSTNSITTSMRLYAETFSIKNRELGIEEYPTSVPSWSLQAKNEILVQPKEFLKMKFCNLLGVTYLDDGGHFLAFQLPQAFSDDVFQAVQAFRDYHMRSTDSYV